MPDTYWDNPICPTPGLEGDGIASRGGEDLTNGRSETANSISGLPTLPTRTSLPSAPSKGDTFEPPDLTNWPTIITK